jgi:hypothetical protein
MQMEGWQKMKKFAKMTITLLALFALCTSSVWAEIGKFKLGGNTELLYGLGYQGISDDNIYRGNGDPNFVSERVVTDWINHIMPAILLDYKIPGRGDIKFGYKGDLAYYETNSDNNWQSHVVPFDLNYYSPAGILVGLKNVYTKTSDPYTNDSDYLNTTTDQVNRELDRLNLKVGYGKLGDALRILGYYNYYIQDYENKARDFSQDYNDNEIGLGVKHVFMPKTWGFLRYHYGLRDYTTASTLVNDSNDSDYSWNRINGGIGWDGGAKWSGELNLGYIWQNYENEFASVYGAPYEDLEDWIAATNVTFKMTESTKIGGILRRKPKQTGSNTIQYNIETAIGVDVSYTAMEKLIFDIRYEYQTNDYNTNRDDKINTFGIGVDYLMMQWLNAGLGYEFKSRESNQGAFDYDQNRWLVSLKGGF